MAPAYISDLINVRKHVRYSLRSNSGTLLLHPVGNLVIGLSVYLRPHFGMRSQLACVIFIIIIFFFHKIVNLEIKINIE